MTLYASIKGRAKIKYHTGRDRIQYGQPCIGLSIQIAAYIEEIDDRTDTETRNPARIIGKVDVPEVGG